MKPVYFKSEADLCKTFIDALPKDWTAYAETGGWDILLVRNADGFQIGVEAKLKLNTDVFVQAMEFYSLYNIDAAQPDCRAIMVPHGQTNALNKIAEYVGLTIIHVITDEQARAERFSSTKIFRPDLPKLKDRWGNEHWHEWAPMERIKLPAYIPDVAAGSKSPIQLTHWKIAAIKIVITLERRGFVTRADFKKAEISPTRWLAAGMGWLKKNDKGQLVAGADLPDFKKQHPIVYAQIAADFDKWVQVVQRSLL